MLRLNGYSTGAFGKWHETAAWETSVSGPFDRWPTHQGFDKFYGFIGGETDQWYPLIYDGLIKVDRAEDAELPLHRGHDQPGHQLGEGAAVDDAGQAVLRLLRDRRDACAAPRAEGVGRQVQGPVRQGLGPGPHRNARAPEEAGRDPGEHASSADRPKDIKAWDTLPADQRRLFARQAEVFSGFLEQTDDEIGRFVKALEDIGEMDNTLFIYIAGDNGTSAEGGFVGMYNEMTYFNGVEEKVEDLIPLIDKWGGPETFPHMSAGWAVAFDTPVHVDQAGGVGLRRHAQRHGHSLAAGHQGDGRPAQPVLPRHRYRARRSWRRPGCRSPRASTAWCRRRSRAPVWSTPSTMRRRPSGTRRSTSRCSAIARSTATAGWPAPSTARHGRPATCRR